MGGVEKKPRRWDRFICLGDCGELHRLSHMSGGRCLPCKAKHEEKQPRARTCGTVGDEQHAASAVDAFMAFSAGVREEAGA